MKAISTVEGRTGREQRGAAEIPAGPGNYPRNVECAGLGPREAFLKENISMKRIFFLRNRKRQYAGRFPMTWEQDQSLLVKIKFQLKEGVGM